MSFAFGIGDMVLVSGAVVNLYNTIKNAAEEQQTLMIEVELLRQFTTQIAAENTLLSVPEISGSASARAHIQQPATLQFCRCFQFLQDLDKIAVKYIGNNTSLQTPGAGKEHRSGLFRWGLYKRKEFVGLLDDLRNMMSSAYSSAKRQPLSRTATSSARRGLLHRIDRRTRPAVGLFVRAL
ncbi:hypothetical protein Q9L58_004064 [Maublancomyces gigas]|uniref:Uncharacterized protein n=1 Tax=Discina gigas TaxID=1032678 RepID=A0ABR3GM26_9PEZI